MNAIVKKIALLGAIAAAVIGSVWFATASMADDRFGVNIVSKGTWSYQAVKDAYNNNKEVRAIYDRYGVGRVINATPVEGFADARNNTITVNGKVVAANVMTVQRRHVNRHQPDGWHKIGNSSYPYYYISNSFESMPKYGLNQPAFVWLDKDGKFIAAIAKDCGNPLWGYAMPVPPKPPKKETPKPALTCNALSAKLVAGTRNTYSFTVAATKKDGATIADYTFDFGDGTTKTTADTTITHTYAKPGNYKVRVTVNGKETAAVHKTSEACATTVTVAADPIKVCDTTTKQIVTIERNDYDKNKQRYTEDMAKCKVSVCDVTSGKIISITKEEKDKGGARYGKPEDCTVKVCDTKKKQVIEVNIKDQHKPGYVDKDSASCKPTTPPTPVTPARPAEPKALPVTGATDTLISFIGIGGLTTAAAAYIASRRQ